MLKDNIVELAKQLISIKSEPDNKEALSDILNLVLSNLEDFHIETFNFNGSPSALVYNTDHKPDSVKVVLNVHLDIIPGKDFQYTPILKGNKLYGAGAMDMKANAAAIIYAFKSVAKKLNYPIALQLVTDEEIGGFNGTKHHIDSGLKTDFVLAAEPTNFDIVHKAKGVLCLTFKSKGISSHGAYPWKGVNAISLMNQLINNLQSIFPNPDQEDWVTTMNIAHISTSNVALNKIPDDCLMKVDIRYIPEDADKLLEKIKSILPNNIEMIVDINEPAFHSDEHDTFIISLAEVAKGLTTYPVELRGAHGSSDARHYSDMHAIGVEFGPVGGGIGTDDEWVDIDSLEIYSQIIVSFLEKLDKQL